ncbi:unnamed protein product [Closterium sp. Yama58-4]|nr:unnamed protein product [Closterium sp. Yama58-4]
METRAVQQTTYSLPSPHSYLRITISVNVSRQQQQGKGEQKGQQKGVQGGEHIQASLLLLSCAPCGPHSVAVLRCYKRHEQQVWAAATAMRHATLNPSVQVVALASSLLALSNPTLHLPMP